MTLEAITEALKRDPFVPFRLWTSSGQHYDVHDPGLVVPLKSRLFVAMSDLERTAMLSYLHITAIEVLENGTKKQRRRGGRGKR